MQDMFDEMQGSLFTLCHYEEPVQIGFAGGSYWKLKSSSAKEASIHLWSQTHIKVQKFAFSIGKEGTRKKKDLFCVNHISLKLSQESLNSDILWCGQKWLLQLSWSEVTQ